MLYLTQLDACMHLLENVTPQLSSKVCLLTTTGQEEEGTRPRTPPYTHPPGSRPGAACEPRGG